MLQHPRCHCPPPPAGFSSSSRPVWRGQSDNNRHRLQPRLLHQYRSQLLGAGVWQPQPVGAQIAPRGGLVWAWRLRHLLGLLSRSRQARYTTAPEGGGRALLRAIHVAPARARGRKSCTVWTRRRPKGTNMHGGSSVPVVALAGRARRRRLYPQVEGGRFQNVNLPSLACTLLPSDGQGHSGEVEDPAVSGFQCYRCRPLSRQLHARGVQPCIYNRALR